MFRRPTAYYLGRVTATATHYRQQHTKYGPTSPITRATGHEFDMAARAALTRGHATLAQVATAAGLIDPPALMGLEDVHTGSRP